MTVLINGTGVSYVAASPATGARDLSVATMQKFADEFTASKATSGWQKLPSGIIIQWGQVSGSGNVGIAFPIAFPNAVLAVTASMYASGSAGFLWAASVGSVTLAGFGIQKRYANGGSVGDAGEAAYWLAIGC